ncbi:hypothetical protein [Clostridium sporogenes]|uniref:hypothetical protein n=1 Tax=Clostridium sporogenes TaxID=1509 RepID=UPI0007178895|nr:hypothetical protein [Clostridium sporogenes]KRU40039.1 hypothetical protein VT94_25160 [Clostridium sporogenes]MBY7065146.1 hypothetical protein [Clostridium sporogenes]MBY7071808.1 hypothetical protein [Clostridium sporogenes]MCW6065866.1 hypothetical protein [Clostridium sporogenes]OQP88563.1 hypothetical protein VT93_0202070 [Clostridium sporogenes]
MKKEYITGMIFGFCWLLLCAAYLINLIYSKKAISRSQFECEIRKKKMGAILCLIGLVGLFVLLVFFI